jgi:hypothetical protein
MPLASEKCIHPLGEFVEYAPGAIDILNTVNFLPFIKKWCGDISHESAQQIISKIIRASNTALNVNDHVELLDKLIEWLDESIVYLIRQNIQIQRFGRDRKAMNLRNSKDWNNWAVHGIISSKLLDCLWIDRSNLFDYNIEIMTYLGLCAKIPDIKNDSFFLIVPLNITNLGHDPINYDAIQNCNLEPRFDEETQDDYLVSYKLTFTKPLAFMCDTLVTRLISRYSTDYDEFNLPEIAVSQVTLLIERKKIILFINWKEQFIKCFISTYAKHQSIYDIIELELTQILATRASPETFNTQVVHPVL